MAFITELDDENLRKAFEVLTERWRQEELPEDILTARVVLIFKKGDAGNMDNYRPISFLNSMYKICAATMQRRRPDKLDKHLHEMQYGFRIRKGDERRNTLHKKDSGQRGQYQDTHNPNAATMGEGLRQSES